MPVTARATLSGARRDEADSFLQLSLAYHEKPYAKTTVRSLVNTLFGKKWTNFGQLKSSTERTSAGAGVFADVQLLPVEDAQVAEV